VVDSAGAIYVIGGNQGGESGDGTWYQDVWASTDGGARPNSDGERGVLGYSGGTRGTRGYYTGTVHHGYYKGYTHEVYSRGTHGVLKGYSGGIEGV
jgi:hypothetical protein